ncbi:MAG TPA: hypothetical protein VGO39_08355 [Gaiellaceae bacterium]|nr:hypothetical protein [Gaiellaceae bacterium]
MDLPLYIRVLWRFRLLVLPGLLAAIALAVLAYGKVDFAHGLKVTPRATPVFHLDALLLVTQEGFPWGASRQPYVAGDAAKGLPPVPVGDFSRMSGIALIYSELVDSDTVKARTKLKPAKTEKLVTSPYAPAGAPPGTVLPMVALSVDTASPGRAAALLNARIAAFKSYIETQQADAHLRAGNRVVVQVLRGGDPATAIVISGKKKTLPIVVFLAVMIAVTGLAFALENMRPRVRRVEPAGELAARRSA